MGAIENNELEHQIIETAKQLFIEKGFARNQYERYSRESWNKPSYPALLFQDKGPYVSGGIRFDSDDIIAESAGHHKAGSTVHRPHKQDIG